jgi:hypothetical protein
MYGIAPTPRENHRNKYRIRLFIEERIVDIGSILLSFGGLCCDAIYNSYLLGVRLKKAAIAHKSYSVVAFLAVVVALAMLL